MVENDKYLSKLNERDESMKEYYRVDFVHDLPQGDRVTKGTEKLDTLEDAQAVVEAWGPRFRSANCRIVRVTEETVK